MGGLSGSGTWPVSTCSHRIAYSSPADVAGMGGRCGIVSVGFPSVLDVARPCRLSISFLISSACRLAIPGVAIVGSGTSVWDWGLLAALGRVLPRPGDWMTVLRLDACLMVGG